MDKLKRTLLGGAALVVPLLSLASPTVYIPLGSANEILIIDAATDKVTGKIDGLNNPHGLSLTPNGEYLVVGSNNEAPVGKNKMAGKPGKPTMEGHGQMVEKSGPSKHDTMNKPGQPPMAKPADMSEAQHEKHHAPAASGLSQAVGVSKISLIRVADNTLDSAIKVQGMAHHTFVTPDGRYAVSTHTSAGTISLIDLTTKKLFRTIHTGPQPNYVEMTQDGKRMYVSNAGNNTLSVIDTKNWIVSQNILVGKGPEHMVMSLDEKFIYINNTRDGAISVVSLEKNKVVKTFTVGKSPHGIDISADGTTLFASLKKDNKLVAIDVKTGKIKTLKLDPAPYHVAVIGNTGKLYVSSRKKPFVWVIDAKKLTVTGKIPIRGEGHQMVVVN